MADANSLLETSLNRSIVDNSTKLADAGQANHTAQLNNFSRAAELLSKNIVEYDLSQALAQAEGMSRISTTSQPYHLANGMALVNASNQSTQNAIAQGFAQLTTMMNAMLANNKS
jgi:hypothetical protein